MKKKKKTLNLKKKKHKTKITRKQKLEPIHILVKMPAPLCFSVMYTFTPSSPCAHHVHLHSAHTLIHRLLGTHCTHSLLFLPTGHAVPLESLASWFLEEMEQWHHWFLPSSGGLLVASGFPLVCQQLSVCLPQTALYTFLWSYEVLEETCTAKS